MKPEVDVIASLKCHPIPQSRNVTFCNGSFNVAHSILLEYTLL